MRRRQEEATPAEEELPVREAAAGAPVEDELDEGAEVEEEDRRSDEAIRPLVEEERPVAERPAEGRRQPRFLHRPKSPAPASNSLFGGGEESPRKEKSREDLEKPAFLRRLRD